MSVGGRRHARVFPQRQVIGVEDDLQPVAYFRDRHQGVGLVCW